MRHKRRLARPPDNVIITSLVGALNVVSGVVQLASGHWTGFVGLGCAAVCVGLVFLELRIYRLRAARTEPPKASGSV